MNLFRRLFSTPPSPDPAPISPPPPPAMDWTSVLDALEEGVLGVDGEKRVILANRGARPFLGRAPAEAVGKPLWEVLRHRVISDRVDRALAGAPAEIADVDWNTDGERVVRVAVSPFSAPGGPGALLTFADLTSTRRLETARKDFVANVSHELKTPLTALRASLETLLDGALDDKDHARDFLSTSLDQVERLQRLIEDLLSLSQLEKPRVLSPASCDAAEVARRVIAALTPVASKRGVSLRPLPTTTACPVALSADELTQVLMNLCDNAIKFNRPGGTVDLALTVQGDRALLRVKDTGPGIPPEDQPRVFERFYRADKARAKETGGTGLGLAIVKHLVENRGGSVRLESRPGEGSLFEVSLPRPPS